MTPYQRAHRSLKGLSLGDAFGECFFGHPELVAERLRERQLPEGEWFWTDDTAMGFSILRILRDYGQIDQDELACAFAAEHRLEPARGYGRGAHDVLDMISEGIPWRRAAGALFEGQGSCGNGAAMRVAPLGAFFCDDLERAATQADLSARVTHAHPEGAAGAIAVAVAAAIACRGGTAEEMWREALRLTPPGEVRQGIERAAALGPLTGPEAAQILGSGAQVMAQDTVPFTLWSASRHWDDYLEAMWTTVSGLGDRDTTCAIVGGIVATRAEPPLEWWGHLEPWPGNLGTL